MSYTSDEPRGPEYNDDCCGGGGGGGEDDDTHLCRPASDAGSVRCVDLSVGDHAPGDIDTSFAIEDGDQLDAADAVARIPPERRLLAVVEVRPAAAGGGDVRRIRACYDLLEVGRWLRRRPRGVQAHLMGAFGRCPLDDAQVAAVLDRCGDAQCDPESDAGPMGSPAPLHERIEALVDEVRSACPQVVADITDSVHALVDAAKADGRAVQMDDLFTLAHRITSALDGAQIMALLSSANASMGQDLFMERMVDVLGALDIQTQGGKSPSP